MLKKHGMGLFESMPANVPTTAAIRMGQSKVRALNRLADDAISAISILSYSSNYGDAITHVAVNPFSVCYQTPDQMTVFRTIRAIHKQKGAAVKISMDASGCFAHVVPHPNGGNSKALLLYAMHTVYQERTVPLGFMLSEAQDSSTIQT